MPNRLVLLEEDQIYHIYNRGVNKGKIFFSENGYDFFVYKMAFHFRETSSVIAYCLMPNHFHILVQVKKSEFVRKSLQPFLIAYTLSVNKDQGRIGPLFQGRYQANLINDDAYLLDCVKYIHLNPVKGGLVKTPKAWKYSSYHEFISPNHRSFIESSFIMRFFENLREFISFSESEIEEDKTTRFFDYE